MFTAVLDADVLAQRWVRILLLQANRWGLYRATFSDDILREVGSRLPRVIDRRTGERLTREQVEIALQRIRDAVDGAVTDGYQALIPVMTNHEGDRHVLAVAVHEHAETIVTWNKAHFPAEACEPYAIQVQNPDEFLTNLWDQNPVAMLGVLTDTARTVGEPDISSFLGHLDRLPTLRASIVNSGRMN